METWRAIPGTGYDASDRGRIRRGLHQARQPGLVMRQKPGDSGYLTVSLSSADGRRCHNVNRLVCAAFHGPPPTAEHHAAHGDNDRSRNVPDNLRWATPAENNADKRDHGTHQAGGMHPRAVVSDDRAACLRATFAAHMDGRSRVERGWMRRLAEAEGLAYHTLRKLVHGRGYDAAASAVQP